MATTPDPNTLRVLRLQVRELIDETKELLQETPLPLDDLQGHLSTFDYLTSMMQDLDHTVMPLLKDAEIEVALKESNDIYKEVRVMTAKVRRNLASSASSPPVSRNSFDTAIHTPIAALPPIHKQFPRLPQLELPKFSGDPLQWTTFWDSYESAIHTSTMPSVDKFNYLKSFLKGIAADSISGISVSNNTYDTAITMIQQRFGQRQIIINAHVESLINIPKAFSETSNLRKLFDSMEIHIRGLETLGITASTNGTILTPILLSKLPSELRLILTRKHGSAVGDLTVLRDLLRTEIEARELSQENFQSQQFPTTVPEFSTGALLLPTKEVGCVFCKNKSHVAFYCRTFSSPSARRAKISEERRCFNCLCRGHNAENCTITTSCRRCGNRHHTSLCSNSGQPPTHSRPPAPPIHRPTQSYRQSNQRTFPRNSGYRNTTHANAMYNGKIEFATTPTPENKTFTTSFPLPAFLATSGSIMMQTALTKVKDPRGNYHIVRLLFDTGSQRSYISSRMFRLLGLKPNAAESLSIAPFGQKGTTTKTYNLTTITCQSLFNADSHAITTIVVPIITHPVHRSALPQSVFTTVSQLDLADPPSSAQSLEIDVLVGLDHYWDIVDDKNIRIRNTSLTAIPSTFGYLLSGKTHSNSTTSSYNALCVGVAAPISENLLKQFWESESFDVSKAHIHDTTKNDPVLLQFENTIVWDGDRYQVHLPWKQDSPNLPTNFNLASERFQGLVHRLQRKDLMLDYDNIIQQQLNANFIEPVDESLPPEGILHYITHHPVVRMDRATTKVRIVYDASAKLSSQHNSLNDCLHPGPNLLNDIQRLLLQFRTFRIVVLADIEKAFLQIGLRRTDRDATRFFWLKNYKLPPDDENIQIYRFCRVPFGATSSPFLLAATLRHHLGLSSNPIIKSLNTQFYVDNMIVGVSTASEAKDLYLTVKQSLRNAGMNLREWTSNCSEFLENLPVEDKATGTTTKVLGVQWNIEDDHISCKSVSDTFQPTDKVTKRLILQTVSRVFDPLGLLSPVIIRAKVFIQDLWKDGLDWDNQVSSVLSSKWNRISEQLCHLSDITLPRHIPTSEKSELHIFVDASQQAYGAAAFIRYQDSSHISSRLLCSKSRVAPAKKVTIPRLELIAAVMGCKLASFITKSIPSLGQNIYIWSDSQIVLHWIKKSNHKLEVFVKNRVDLIRSFEYKFAYCPTSQNSADLCTRGTSTEELQFNKLWWDGPTWLSATKDQWPQYSETINNLGVNTDASLNSPVVQMQCTSLKIHTPFSIDVNRYSTLEKLLGVTSYCNRFIDRLCHRDPMFSSRPTAEELDKSRSMWIKCFQHAFFYEEIRLLNRKSTNSRIKELHLIITDGILRCQGRFQNANIHQSSLNPILLPKNNYYTDLVIMHYHIKTMHQGVRHTVNSLRQHFWIPNARQQVNSTLRKCLICRYWNGPSFPAPPIPALPASRVTQAPSFSYSGCDFAGPIYVYDQNTTTKAYICLFTCAVTRALHLELVNDMSTGTFILALKRFISRRGVPIMMISDNAKTFKMTKTVIERLWLNVIIDPETTTYIASHGIKWRFNVERAPWWGGFYERLVGLVKRSLVKASGKTKLTTIQLTTLLTEIEAILNSRPLTYVYTDSEAGEPLTPNSFLFSSRQGIPTPAVDTDPDFKDVPATELLTKLHHNQRTLDYYWSIWHTEYLHQLREYHIQWQKKSKSCKQVPAIGDVVLVKEDGQKRGSWKLGIIQKVYPGSDGNIRSVQVKCKLSLLNRAVTHLYPLELNSPSAIQSTEPTAESKASDKPKRQAAQRAVIAIRQQAQSLQSSQSSDEPL